MHDIALSCQTRPSPNVQDEFARSDEHDLIARVAVRPPRGTTRGYRQEGNEILATSKPLQGNLVGRSMSPSVRESCLAEPCRTSEMDSRTHWGGKERQEYQFINSIGRCDLLDCVRLHRNLAALQPGNPCDRFPKALRDLALSQPCGDPRIADVLPYGHRRAKKAGHPWPQLHSAGGRSAFRGIVALPCAGDPSDRTLMDGQGTLKPRTGGLSSSFQPFFSRPVDPLPNGEAL